MKLIKAYTWFMVILLALGCTSNSSAIVNDDEEYDVNEIVTKKVVGFDQTVPGRFINNSQLYRQGWDTLPQARFWQDIITLSHDSMILNVAAVRQPLFRVPSNEWFCQTENEKDTYKKNICINQNLEPGTDIYVTGGKKFFFEFRKALPMISSAIPVFEKNGTDPWYAQTILLIESPGKTEARSYVGARGPFQLMPYVARKFGLVVTKYKDERTDLYKSADAASRFISAVCLPGARKILDERSIPYNEKDLWFRLFVMHVYHAGAGNVAAVVNKINPDEGGMNLIRTMWQTEAAGFKNESQNYSQIALAAIISFDKIISQDNEFIYLVSGDKNMKMYHQRTAICVDTLNYLNDCISAYESDLIDGMIPFSYFVSAVEKVKSEIRDYENRNGIYNYNHTYDESDRLLVLGQQLMYKRKYQDAVDVFRLGLESNPVSVPTYDSLGRAYKLLGKSDMALQLSKQSKKVLEDPSSFVK